MVWAVLDGAVPRCASLAAAAGAAAAAHGGGVPPASSPPMLAPVQATVRAVDKKEEAGARGQREYWRDGRRGSKENDTDD